MDDTEYGTVVLLEYCTDFGIIVMVYCRIVLYPKVHVTNYGSTDMACSVLRDGDKDYRCMGGINGTETYDIGSLFHIRSLQNGTHR